VLLFFIDGCAAHGCKTQFGHWDMNKFVFSSFLRTLTTWHYPRSPPLLLRARQQSINSSACRTHNSSGFAAVGPYWNRQTAGQRTLHRP